MHTGNSPKPPSCSFRSFVAAGRPVVGIGSGFQALIRTGILPGALALNASGHFQCEWVELEAPATRCLWTQGLSPIECPIASSEGRYVHPDPETLADNGQVALRYRHTNPNGSVANIAGVCDTTGVVLGLMPNPEHHVLPRQHPLQGLHTLAHEQQRAGQAHVRLRLLLSPVIAAVLRQRPLRGP